MSILKLSHSDSKLEKIIPSRKLPLSVWAESKKSKGTLKNADKARSAEVN